MIKHELHHEGKKVLADLAASTKAGLMTSAIEALAAAMESSPGPEKEVEREFTVEAAGFKELMEALVQNAIDTGIDKKEIYDGVRFSLITATKAVGELLGRPIESRGVHVTTAQVREDVVKSEDGMWTTKIEFVS
jgi:hypothetical protein